MWGYHNHQKRIHQRSQNLLIKANKKKDEKTEIYPSLDAPHSNMNNFGKEQDPSKNNMNNFGTPASESKENKKSAALIDHEDIEL